MCSLSPINNTFLVCNATEIHLFLILAVYIISRPVFLICFCSCRIDITINATFAPGCAFLYKIRDVTASTNVTPVFNSGD